MFSDHNYNFYSKNMLMPALFFNKASNLPKSKKINRKFTELAYRAGNKLLNRWWRVLIILSLKTGVEFAGHGSSKTLFPLFKVRSKTLSASY